MKRYEKYKPTGIQWLPEIPEYWEAVKIKYCFNQRSEKGFPNEPILCATQSRGVIPQTLYENRVVVVNKGFEGLKLVKVGDFVISLRSFQGGIEYAYYQGIISSAYTILSPQKESSSPYFKYLFKSHPFIQLLQTCVTGIREGQNINYSVFGNSFIPIPPIPEQNKIVAYLDKRITLIDNCKCQRERERELQTLNELKQAEIASVVTRGLNPDVPMKDSGIPWIGQIPDHWELRRFKTVCSLIREPSKNGDKKIALENIETNTGRLIATDSVFDGEGVHFEPGDILFGKLRPYLAKVYLAKESAQAVGDFYVFRSNGSIIPAYLHKLIISAPFIGVVNAGTYGTKMPRASWQDISQLNIPLPPIEEQNAIVEYIESKTNKIDTMIEALKAEIDRLTEYKQRLISDVVTGQIDVRGEQIQ